MAYTVRKHDDTLRKALDSRQRELFLRGRHHRAVRWAWLVDAGDRSFVALMGALPGALTAASIALDVLEQYFGDRLTDHGLLPALARIPAAAASA